VPLRAALALLRVSHVLQVRSLVCSCLARLYTAGDLLPLFSRINGLQGFLQDKHSTATEVGARVGDGAWSQQQGCNNHTLKLPDYCTIKPPPLHNHHRRRQGWQSWCC
jgi:hypothetical protein